jgi:senataxin
MHYPGEHVFQCGFFERLTLGGFEEKCIKLCVVKCMLHEAPVDFWDAMQTISPQAIMEHTFYNTQFNAFLLESNVKNRQADGWWAPFREPRKGLIQESMSFNADFYNTQFNAFLLETSEGEPFEKSALKDMLSWINPFLL